MRELVHSNKNERAFFAAANGGDGFFSFYDEIFSTDRLERRYLIKGGAGSGKSSFMRRIADMAEQSGIDVEYYYCSSDYSSLDGIIIGGRVAIIDATAPHTVECALAGALDEIVDTGSFWDSRMLGAKREKIGELSRRKSELYSGAYRYLEAALAIDRRCRELAERYIDYEKLNRAVKRIVSSLDGGKVYEQTVGLRRSIGMKGRCRMDSYERSAERLIAVECGDFTGGIFIKALVDEAKRKKCRVKVSYDPLNNSIPDAVLFCDGGVAVVVGENSAENSQKVNMKRFWNFSGVEKAEEKSVKSELRNGGRIINMLTEAACGKLSEAGEMHFALEKIYGEAMDFDSEREFCEKLGKGILERFKLPI